MLDPFVFYVGFVSILFIQIIIYIQDLRKLESKINRLEETIQYRLDAIVEAMKSSKSNYKL